MSTPAVPAAQISMNTHGLTSWLHLLTLVQTPLAMKHSHTDNMAYTLLSWTTSLNLQTFNRLLVPASWIVGFLEYLPAS